MYEQCTPESAFNQLLMYGKCSYFAYQELLKCTLTSRIHKEYVRDSRFIFVRKSYLVTVNGFYYRLVLSVPKNTRSLATDWFEKHKYTDYATCIEPIDELYKSVNTQTNKVSFYTSDGKSRFTYSVYQWEQRKKHMELNNYETR